MEFTVLRRRQHWNSFNELWFRNKCELETVETTLALAGALFKIFAAAVLSPRNLTNVFSSPSEKLIHTKTIELISSRNRKTIINKDILRANYE